MQRTHVLLNIIYIQADPPPKGGGFTDPLSGTLNWMLAKLLARQQFYAFGDQLAPPFT